MCKHQTVRVMRGTREHSFLLQNEGPPVAGGTVFVKLKPCKYSVATGSRVESSEHSHTRRYILPRLKSYYNSLQISKQY